ncbi:MAG: mannose-6-phosphate isomerase-like protein (cupin superfamily) [Porticoccus sp.]|jgi:mannose-6-phosphate isomerase-like protein (cupin superfamily)
MKAKLTPLLSLFFCLLQANAGKLVLSDSTQPSDLDNIHVVKLSSDSHATDFIIFVKQQVPLHKHLVHTETLYVLEGSGAFQLDDASFDIGPGDYINVPEGTPHAVTVTSSIPLKVLSIKAPEFLGKDRVAVKATY